MAEDQPGSIHDAAKQGKLETIGQYLAQGQDLNVKDKLQRTPLHLAAWAGQVEVVKVLLSNDSVNAKAKAMDDMTALHFAAQNGHTEVARHLLNAGANVNSKTRKGATALHLASQRGHISVVELLLKRKASPFLTDKRHENALDKCQDESIRAMVQAAMDQEKERSQFNKSRKHSRQASAGRADGASVDGAGPIDAAVDGGGSSGEDEDEGADVDVQAHLKRTKRGDASSRARPAAGPAAPGPALGPASPEAATQAESSSRPRPARAPASTAPAMASVHDAMSGGAASVSIGPLQAAMDSSQGRSGRAGLSTAESGLSGATSGDEPASAAALGPFAQVPPFGGPGLGAGHALGRRVSEGWPGAAAGGTVAEGSASASMGGAAAGGADGGAAVSGGVPAGLSIADSTFAAPAVTSRLEAQEGRAGAGSVASEALPTASAGHGSPSVGPATATFMAGAVAGAMGGSEAPVMSPARGPVPAAPLSRTGSHAVPLRARPPAASGPSRRA